MVVRDVVLPDLQYFLEDELYGFEETHPIGYLEITEDLSDVGHYGVGPVSSHY